MCDMSTHVIHVDVCDTCLESIMATEKEFFILYSKKNCFLIR